MPDDIVLDSIRKMLQLKMPDDEILASLVDAGVDYDLAVKQLNEIKNGKSKDNKKKDKKDLALDNASLGVWQEGIITIINQKLDEIENKQKALNNEITSKINEINSKELSKMKLVIDSQRTLLASKLDMSVASKLKEIKQQVDSTLNVLQDVDKETQRKLSKIEDFSKEIASFKDSLTDQLDIVQDLQDNLNKALEDFKQKSSYELNRFFNTYSTKLDEITNKTNNTLSLSHRILESLVNASIRKIDAYCNEKLDAFFKDLNSKINAQDLKTAIEQVTAFKDIDAKISNSIEKHLANNKDNGLDDSISDLNRRLMDIEKRASKQDLQDRLEELELFKEQTSNILAKLISDNKIKIKDEKKK